MQPLSNVLPKPALPVPGGPVVSWGLRLLARSGVRTVVLNSWWLAETMERAAAEAAPPELDLLFSREEHLMETAGGLALARDRGLLGTNGPILAVNGDSILDIDIEDLFRRHRETNDLVTLGLLPHPGPERWSRVLLDRDGLVSAILPPGPPARDEMPLLYPGVMLIARRALESLETKPSGVASALWGPARTQGRLGGVQLSGPWREVGIPADYLETAMALLGERNDLHRSARIPGNTVLNRSLIGPDVIFEENVVVDQSIISHGAVIGAGAQIRRSVILGDVRISAGESVTDDIRVTARPIATDPSQPSTEASSVGR